MRLARKGSISFRPKLVSEFQVQAKTRHKYWPAIAVVSRMVDILKVEGRIESAPSMHRVIRLHDIFAPIVQPAVSQQESVTTQRQVFLVVARNPVGDNRQARAIESSAPLFSAGAQANLIGRIHFGVRVGFVLPLVPSP